MSEPISVGEIIADMLNNSLAEFKERSNKARESRKCVICDTPIKFERDNNDGTPGRIYSNAGVQEYRISATCETCFDNMYGDDDDED